MRSVLTVALCLALATAADAQEARTGAEPASATRTALAQRLAKVGRLAEMLTQSFANASVTTQANYEALEGRAFTREEKVDFDRAMQGQSEPLAEELSALVTQKLAETFTDAELQAQIDLYSTPVGQSILTKSLDFNTALFQEAMSRGMAAGVDAHADFCERRTYLKICGEQPPPPVA